jgi:hypothetical protein
MSRMNATTAFHIVSLGMLGLIFGLLLAIYRSLERIEYILNQAKTEHKE